MAEGEEEVPQPLRAGLGLELLDERQRPPGVAGAALLREVGVVRRLDRVDLLGDERGDAGGQVRRAGDGLKSMMATLRGWLTAGMTRTAALVVVTGLLLAGCSDDGPEEVPEGVRTGLAALYAGDHPEAADTEDGACFADELLARASLDDLREAGLVTGDEVATDVPPLPADLAGTWVDAQFACVDFVEQSARAQVAASKGAIDAEAYAACLREEISEDQLRAAVAQALTGDLTGTDVSRLSTAQLTCATA